MHARVGRGAPGGQKVQPKAEAQLADHDVWRGGAGGVGQPAGQVGCGVEELAGLGQGAAGVEVDVVVRVAVRVAVVVEADLGGADAHGARVAAGRVINPPLPWPHDRAPRPAFG